MSFFEYLPAAAKSKAKEATRKKSPSVSSASTSKTSSSFIRAPAPRTTTKTSTTQSAKRSTPAAKKSKSDQNGVFVDAIDVETCDITYIDEQIKKKLRSKIRILPDLQKDLAKLLWIIQSSTDSVDKIHAKTESSILRRSIQDIEGGFELALYLLKTADLLEEYSKIVTETSSSSFVRVTKNTEGDDKLYRKSQIRLEFLRIAKSYVTLENFHQKPQRIVCDACHATNSTRQQSSDDTTLVCKCGATIDMLDDTPSFKDAERVNMASRYTYTCRGHFNEAMNRFEGKQNTEIDQSVIDTLRSEIVLHGLTNETVTKDHIYMFLSESKLSDYYADINLIYFLITNINPPDITIHRPELLEMFDQLEEAYQEVKDDDRLNSLNVNWKLYKLLQLLEFNCKKDDFFCLKTPTKQGEHEEKWYSMIEYLRGKYPKAVTASGKKRWRHIRTL